MSRATYPLKLPDSVKKAAQRLAKEDGVSLNQWIAAAVAEKVGVVETAAAFFRKRAGNAKGDRLLKFLRNSPNNAPEPGDRVSWYSGAFLFFWTFFVLALTGLFSFVLSVRGLWNLRRARPPRAS
ncbi:MAG TPA: hypothetical protein VFN26_06230 [Candidatus Acidoferrum sp.]|nr:hypothetical protein [Candidatus Acidoferrum sp.]